MHDTMDMNHGHLTPSKILFVEDDSKNFDIKINGFGPGKMLSALSKTRFFDKTIYYKSPEIITNNKYSHSSDMFAVGIITFLLLFGYHPFQPTDGTNNNHFGKYETKLVSDKIKKGFICKVRRTSKHGKGPWFPNDINCSIEAMDFIAQLLQHKPRKRYSAEFALTHPFITNRKKLKSNVISKNVLNSINEFHKNSMYKQYILQVFHGQYDIIDSQCFQQLEVFIISFIFICFMCDLIIVDWISLRFMKNELKICLFVMLIFK